jgi:starch phosphorylase
VRHGWRRTYRPRDHYEHDPELREVLDLIASGYYSRCDPDLFRPLVDSLLDHDPFLVLADFRAYLECQGEVERAFADPARWTRMSILNVARMGRFSSDRAITDYCHDIWHVDPVPVPLAAAEG